MAILFFHILGIIFPTDELHHFSEGSVYHQQNNHLYIYTWWLIPLSKWVITPVISGLTLLIPFITGVITHLLSGMSHQVPFLVGLMLPDSSLLICSPQTIAVFTRPSCKTLPIPMMLVPCSDVHMSGMSGKVISCVLDLPVIVYSIYIYTL